jgi:hypothetical protein
MSYAWTHGAFMPGLVLAYEQVATLRNALGVTSWSARNSSIARERFIVRLDGRHDAYLVPSSRGYACG